MFLTQSCRDGESQTAQVNATNNIKQCIIPYKCVELALLCICELSIIGGVISNLPLHTAPYTISAWFLWKKWDDTQLPGYVNFTYQLLFFHNPGFILNFSHWPFTHQGIQWHSISFLLLLYGPQSTAHLGMSNLYIVCEVPINQKSQKRNLIFIYIVHPPIIMTL